MRGTRGKHEMSERSVRDRRPGNRRKTRDERTRNMRRTRDWRDEWEVSARGACEGHEEKSR